MVLCYIAVVLVPIPFKRQKNTPTIVMLNVFLLNPSSGLPCRCMCVTEPFLHKNWSYLCKSLSDSNQNLYWEALYWVLHECQVSAQSEHVFMFYGWIHKVYEMKMLEKMKNLKQNNFVSLYFWIVLHDFLQIWNAESSRYMYLCGKFGWIWIRFAQVQKICFLFPINILAA